LPLSLQEPITLTVDQPTTRLDQFLAQAIPNLSRTQLQKIIRQGEILVNQQIARPSMMVHEGDMIEVAIITPTETAPQAETIPLRVVYEDDDIVVINKAAGMVVHPAHGHEAGTLVNALLARYPALANWPRNEQQDEHDRPGIVHRLDQGTSGLLVVALNPAAQQHLQAQFKGRAVQKTYLALVIGLPPAPEGVIDVPLGRDPRNRQRIAPQTDGKASRTHYRTRQNFSHYTLLEVGLETGRTHQIRVHLAWLKCPVVGDTLYGRKKNDLGLNRQFLHSWQLQFSHPRTESPMSFEAPLDKELAAILENLS